MRTSATVTLHPLAWLSSHPHAGAGGHFKIDTPFGFETRIDMRRYLRAAADGPAAAGRPAAPLLYELYAVLVHKGSANFGHYYALIKDLESAEWCAACLRPGRRP